MMKLNAIVPATARKRSQRLIVTFVELPRPTSAAPATTPVAPTVDSKQKHCASLRGSFDAERRVRSRIATSRTRLCKSSNAETPTTICQSGVGEGKYGHTNQLMGARMPISNISIHSARVFILSFNGSTVPNDILSNWSTEPDNNSFSSLCQLPQNIL